jgi:drug/metabolite transporter (DMT)-like permease
LVVDLEPLVLVALNQVMGLAAIGLVWLIAQELPVPLTPFLLAWALLSGILLHGLPFWLHTLVLKELPASLSAFFISLIPVVSIGGAWAFLQETITLWQLLGTVLVLAAVTAVSLRPASP